jgi:hypothetical protein
MMTPGWLAASWVQVEVGNRITWQMTRLPSGEILGGELDPNPLGLGFVESSVGEGGSALWNGVAGRSVIERFVVPIVRGSTAGDPLLSISVVWVLTSPASMNGVIPSGGSTNRPRSTCVLRIYGLPNGGSGSLSSDCSGGLGGDGSIGRYCGGGVAAHGLLLQGQWHR